MLPFVALTVAVQGGVDLARIQTDDNVDSAFLPAAVFGASAALDVAPPLALRLELAYLKKRGRITVGGPAGPTTDYALSYLTLPINLRWDLGSGPTLAYLFAGTTFGALLAATEQHQGAASTSVKGDLHDLEVTLDLGFGIGYRLTPAIAIVFDVRYSLGLTQVAADRAALDVSSWTSRTIQMVAGIAYTFGARPPETPAFALSP
jgi:hypothetical protein